MGRNTTLQEKFIEELIAGKDGGGCSWGSLGHLLGKMTRKLRLFNNQLFLPKGKTPLKGKMMMSWVPTGKVSASVLVWFGFMQRNIKVYIYINISL